MADEIVPIGKIGAPYGVLGWVKLHFSLADLGGLEHFSRWYLAEGDAWVCLSGFEYRCHGKGYVGTWDTCSDRTQAQEVTHGVIGVLQTEFPALAEDEYYWSDLIGCAVVTPQEELLGHIDHFLDTRAHDVMVVQDKESQERLIPFVIPDIVQHVDLQARCITVAWERDF